MANHEERIAELEGTVRQMKKQIEQLQNSQEQIVGAILKDVFLRLGDETAGDLVGVIAENITDFIDGRTSEALKESLPKDLREGLEAIFSKLGEEDAEVLVGTISRSIRNYIEQVFESGLEKRISTEVSNAVSESNENLKEALKAISDLFRDEAGFKTGLLDKAIKELK